MPASQHSFQFPQSLACGSRRLSVTVVSHQFLSFLVIHHWYHRIDIHAHPALSVFAVHRQHHSWQGVACVRVKYTVIFTFMYDVEPVVRGECHIILSHQTVKRTFLLCGCRNRGKKRQNRECKTFEFSSHKRHVFIVVCFQLPFFRMNPRRRSPVRMCMPFQMGSAYTRISSV